MAVPSSYTEETLATYMGDILGALAVDLDLDPSGIGPYQEPINETLLAYGTTDIATVTGTAGITLLRALARVQAWKLAIATLSAYYDFSDGTQSLKRSQMFAHAKEALAMAEADASALGGGDMAVGIDTIRWANDPYATLITALVPE